LKKPQKSLCLLANECLYNHTDQVSVQLSVLIYNSRKRQTFGHGINTLQP